MNTRTKSFFWQIITFLVMALILFCSAGTLTWPAGWIYMALFIGFSVSITLWLLKHCPDLLEERIGFKPDQKLWDKVFLVALNVLFFAWLILMPMDAVRFHRSGMPAWLQAVGAAVLIFSFYIFYLAFRENPYLSASVRIQEDRGQVVISTGPYEYVRHPMYSGGFLFFLGTALLLGSWWGVACEPVFVAMIAARAVAEERMLVERLKGYEAYMEQAKYRFIPWIC